MHRCKNIAITGAKGAGKSTLASWLLNALGLPFAGFQTLRYAMTAAGPLYELEELSTKKRQPISELREEGIRGIPESFEGFGAEVVARAAASAAPVILLDEIGRFERNSPRFLRSLTAALDSEKTVVAVLKQEPLPHILSIRERSDTLLIDLDRRSREEARKILSHWMEKL